MNNEQERITFLEQKLAQQAEENFELQAALAVAEAECQHQIQTVERQLQQTERHLRDQLRRSQHEANLVRAQNKQQQQPQQQQRIPHTIVAPTPPATTLLLPQTPTPVPKESCGMALARHILLVDRQTPFTFLLLQIVARNRPISVVNVVGDCLDFVYTLPVWQADHLKALYSILHLSPQACRLLFSTMKKETSRISRRIRRRGEYVHLKQEAFENPLWSPTLAIEPAHRPRSHRGELLLQRIRETCISQTHNLELSMAGMKVLCLFLEHEDVWSFKTELLQLFRRAALWLIRRGNGVLRLINPESSNNRKGNNNNEEETTEPYPFSKRHKTRLIQEWLSVCLATLVEFWNHSRRDAVRYGFWTQAESSSYGGPVREVMATVLDLMERVLLPNSALLISDLTMACVSWLHAMLQTNSAAHWLLSQMPTSQSTPETWHRAGSAVGVMVKLSHAVVVEQEMQAEKGVDPNIWNPVRDQSICFMQGILRMVQSQRREWEEQPAQPKKPPSFSSLVAYEYPELYTSIVTSLLYVDTEGLVVSSDMQSMLQQQLEEIKMDQQEREDQAYLSMIKQ
ncbi:hypothetical protein FisN_13Lh317 [Fistulifera solaris]|uniref:Uncharacterized protein n=1 Tax=Fistulifera solaris TaxID=1519565 RepID=A0A1Z5KLE0_FISSO|nr:hypothetical protein FisN_13Lh317 [Fistulifera solaris]|eukprot:GAX27133.1 hypothetical protein FisN_13Lh317 [Fistulifera solaris]